MNLFEAFKRRRKPEQKSDEIQTAKILIEEQPDKKDSDSNYNDAIRRLALLTPREHELFSILLEGYTLKESAKQMSVKYSTANTHMTGIYKKLNVKSRAELIIRYRDIVTRTNNNNV